MGISEILTQIDREIALLQQARALLAGGRAPNKVSGAKAASVKPRKKRKLTPEGRRRIAEAVKRRWAEHRKATQGK